MRRYRDPLCLLIVARPSIEGRLRAVTPVISTAVVSAVVVSTAVVSTGATAAEALRA